MPMECARIATMPKAEPRKLTCAPTMKEYSTPKEFAKTVT